MTFPTLSVLLPTYRDGWRLGVQLESILPQLSDQDELILLLDGSDTRTRLVASLVTDTKIRFCASSQPSGVCNAYNWCAVTARKDWILGASGNDELQPGALNAWREAVAEWPDARIVQGQIEEASAGRTLETSFLTPAMLPPIWRNVGWHTHGAATFLRRDVWGRGYVPAHAWMADSFQSTVLGWRWGLVDLHHYISRVHFAPDQFSAQHTDLEKRLAACAAIRATLAEPEYDDVRHMASEFQWCCEWLEGAQELLPAAKEATCCTS